MTAGGFSAVVLAGGAGRRLGGAAKPSLPVGGRPMLARVLSAVEHATVCVVVGPTVLAPLLPRSVHLIQEEPQRAGPVAALAAGLAAVPRDPVEPAWIADEHERREPAWTAVLAADLPLLTPAAIELLLGHADSADREGSTVDGVVYVDDTGQPQWLCGVWRTVALRRALNELGAPEGRALRELFSGIQHLRVDAAAGAPPWYDCDTPIDMRRAEEWIG